LVGGWAMFPKPAGSEASAGADGPGDLRDAQGRYGRRRWNLCGAKPRQMPEAAPHYDIKGANITHSALADGLLRRPAGQSMVRVPTKSEAGVRRTRRHVFWSVFPRSGTTLMEILWPSHPDIVPWMNATTWVRQRAKFLVDDAGMTRLVRASPDEMERIAYLLSGCASWLPRGQEKGLCRGAQKSLSSIK